MSETAPDRADKLIALVRVYVETTILCVVTYAETGDSEIAVAVVELLKRIRPRANSGLLEQLDGMSLEDIESMRDELIDCGDTPQGAELVRRAHEIAQAIVLSGEGGDE